MHNVVIAGAGLAGLTTAVALRRLGHDGRIVMLGDEAVRPYDRPPLSKKVLTGEWPPEKTSLTTPGELDRLGIEWIPSAAAELDQGSRSVFDMHGTRFPFDDAVVATGLSPRTIGGVAHAATLRTLDDAMTLRPQIGSGRRVVVIGGGFLGLEIAGTASALGARVTVIEPTAAPLSTKLGDDVAGALVRRLGDAQVDVQTSTAVLDSTFGSGFSRLSLSSGVTLDADAVVAAVGSIPNVGWLRSSGLVCTDGVVCDSTGLAAEGVWAAGDVANHRGEGRSEHRTSAQDQGMHVARNIVSGESAPYSASPFFWTDHPGVKVQLWGRAARELELVVVEGSLAGDRMVGTFVDDAGSIVGVIAWNAAAQSIPWRRRLADTSTAAAARPR